MTEQEFRMNLLIGGWVVKTPDEDDNSGVDTIYTNTDSVFSMGTKEGTDMVKIFQSGKPLGSRRFDVAFNEIHEHMVLMQSLNL